MEILTEFDELQAAMAKINLDECVLPYVRGRLVVNESAFNKTQKILNCPEMISAHKYLYNLDMDQLTEDEVSKIDELYKLGCDRGFIVDDLTDWDAEDGKAEDAEEDVKVADVEEKPVEQSPSNNTLFKSKVPCWTVIYSATKDGAVKTGEAYSNAISIAAAKADVNAKLSQCGYSNITILAIESCNDAVVPPMDVANAAQVSEADEEKEDEESKEDTKDDAADDSSDDSSNDDAAEDEPEDEQAEDSSSDEDAKDDSSEEDSGDESAEDDSSSGDDEEKSSDDSADGEGDDSEKEGSSNEDSSEDASDEEDSGEDEDTSSDGSEEASGDEDKEELDANEKAELRDLYRKTFKNTLVKCKFDTSFNDLTLEQKVKFFTELSKAWKKDNEPKEFMTDKELEQLDNVVASPSSDEE